MIEFGGQYLVNEERIEYIGTRDGTEEYPFCLYIRLKSGQELGVLYRTELLRKQASALLARAIEDEHRDYAERIICRLGVIERKIGTLDKRQMRIWRQLKTLMGVNTEEKP